MTCIVGVVQEGRVTIGGDSAGVAGYDLTVRQDRKVFTLQRSCIAERFVMGFTTSFRMGQILQYRLTPPEIPHGADLMKYMATTFIDAVRESLKSGGWASKHEETERGGCFLVGVRGRLFVIHSDYQVGETTCGFDAVGCGAVYAIGALSALRASKGNAEKRVLSALEIAERWSAGVRGPFHLESA